MKSGPLRSSSATHTAIPVDSNLPNLAIALDQERIFPHLKRAGLPEHAVSCRIQYIRYKPGTNCIVLYRVSLDQSRPDQPQTVWAYAKLFNAARPPRASDEWLLSRYDARRKIAFAVFPRDLQMPALRLATSRRDSAKLLKGAMRRSRHARFLRHWGEWTPVRYKPERRCVMMGEYDSQHEDEDRSGKRFFARFYASSEAEFCARWYRYFDGLDGAVPTPRYLGYGQKYRLLLLKKLPGIPLRSFLKRPDEEAGPAVDAAAFSLAAWHRLTPPPGAPHRSEDSRQLHDAAGVLEALLGRKSLPATELAGDLVSTRPQPEETCLLHGDFYYDQVVVGRQPSQPVAGFLDLDNVAVGDPVIDVASFCAQLRLEVALGRVEAERCDWMCRRFVESYQSASGRAIPDQHLRWHTAALMLKLAIWPFRRFQEQWQESTERLIAEACEWGERVQC